MSVRWFSLGLAATSFACGSVTGQPDAATGDATGSSDASAVARCDPAKPFGTPIPVPNINTSNDETNFTLTRDELTGFVGYVVQPPVSTGQLLVTQRASLGDDFAAPSGALTTAINDATGTEYAPSSVADGLSLYFHRQTSADIAIIVASRADRSSAFPAGATVTAGGSGLVLALGAEISSDGSTLYWLDYNDFKLWSATRGATPSDFVGKTLASTFALGGTALSADELTLFYSNGNGDDVLSTTRASKQVAFEPGAIVPNINTAQQDKPVFLTRDGCVLYLSSNRPGGLGGTDIWQARRPL